MSKCIHAAELNYANQEMEECLDKLQWITQLLNTVDRSINSGVISPEYLGARQKIAAINTSIGSGLDVFGRGRNYVPLTSFAFHRENTHAVIGYAASIESSLDQLKGLTAKQADARVKARDAIDKLDAAIKRREQAQAVEFEEVAILQNSIKNLEQVLNDLWNDLESANDEFQQAVKDQAECGFGNVLQFATMVTTVISTGGAAIGVVSGLGATVNNLEKLNNTPTGKGSWSEVMGQNFKAMAKAVEPAGKSIGEFKSSYQSARKQIDALNEGEDDVRPGGPSSDFMKLVANKKDFDQAIKEFMDLPEARAYKRLMDLFVSTAETRNNEIIEHDEKIARIFNMWAESAIDRKEIGEVSAALEVDFDLPGLRDYLDQALTRIKWEVARSLNSLARAIEYQSLESILIPIDDRNVATLQSSMAQIVLEHVRIKETFGQSAQKGLGIKVPLASLFTERQVEALLSGESAIFSIRPDDDEFWPRYSVTTLRITLGELPRDLQSQALNVRFEHLGRSVMKDRERRLQVYSHRPVRTLFQTNIRGDVVENGLLIDERSREYVGVSPYGPWKVKFEVDGLDDLRSIIEQAVVVFDVQGRVLPIG